jgi:hypothetical protein
MDSKNWVREKGECSVKGREGPQKRAKNATFVRGGGEQRSRFYPLESGKEKGV